MRTNLTNSDSFCLTTSSNISKTTRLILTKLQARTLCRLSMVNNMVLEPV
jgi:hypothetical protein